MPLQKGHNLTDHFLIGPTGDYALSTFFTDAVNFEQPFGFVLDDIEDCVSERIHQAPGEDRADALDQARAEISLHTLD